MKVIGLILGMVLTVLGYQAHAEITAKYRFQIDITYNFLMKSSGGALLLKGKEADYAVDWSGKVYNNGEELSKLTIENDGVTFDQPLEQLSMIVDPSGKKVWVTVYKSEEGKQNYYINDDRVSWNAATGEVEDLELSVGEAIEFQMVNHQALTAISNTQVQNTLNKMFNNKLDLNVSWVISFKELNRPQKIECGGSFPIATCKYSYAFDMSAKQMPEVEISQAQIDAAKKPKSARKEQEEAERASAI